MRNRIIATEKRLCNTGRMLSIELLTRTSDRKCPSEYVHKTEFGISRACIVLARVKNGHSVAKKKRRKEERKLSPYVRVSDSVKLLRYVVQVLSTGTFYLRKFLDSGEIALRVYFRSTTQRIADVETSAVRHISACRKCTVL